jgi:hypothetical protein
MKVRHSVPKKDPRDYRLKAYTNEVVRRMFVTTADGNYILARSAYFLRLPFDFYWLGLHALEKYYKAVLLMNGLSAKGYRHDLIRLNETARSIAGRLLKTRFKRPPIKELRWFEESVDDYVARLNRFGSAHNRYATYGYWLLDDELFKLDQLVWQVRRCCRPFHLERPVPGEKPINTNNKKLLRLNKREWKVNRWPLEELIEGPDDDPRRSTVLLFNLPFAPEGEHKLAQTFSASHAPPLADWFRLLRASTQDTRVENSASKVLKWVDENIDFGREDRELLRKALHDHRAAHMVGKAPTP